MVAVSVALALLLCGCMMHFWRKTQSLEYKYMKLVQSSGGRDGDIDADACALPPAESCALGEEDAEEEDVAFSAPSSQGLLNRIRAMRGKVRNHSCSWCFSQPALSFSNRDVRRRVLTRACVSAIDRSSSPSRPRSVPWSQKMTPRFSSIVPLFCSQRRGIRSRP